MNFPRGCTGLRPLSAAALIAGLCLASISAEAANPVSPDPAAADTGGVDVGIDDTGASAVEMGAALAKPAKPNIVLIMTDDEDVASHAFMPKTKALLAERGTTFESFFATYPLCCPARASILRGQYAHNTQIVGNEQPYGGYEKLHALGLEKSTLATWLQEAGYHTAMVGKYINRYVPDLHGVPPGWQDWYVGGNSHVSYNYALNENGRIVRYGDSPEDYLNDVLTGKAVTVIRQAAAAGQPLFLYVLPYTPHSPSAAAPRHEGLFDRAVMPRSPAFDEADVSDKPAFIRNLPPLDAERIALLESEYRRRLASLQAIDDMVESLVAALEETGQLDNSYIVYSSDNGFHLGEHRLPAGKDMPYEEDIRVPAILRGPGVPEGARIDALVLNIDLAPTFAEIAGIEPPAFVDGRSFLPLLADPLRPWRQSFLIERRQLERQYIGPAKDQGLSAAEIERAARFDGLRTRDRLYVEYGTGERELYDLAADPYQLANLAKEAEPALLAALSERLSALADCAGALCRELEDLPLGTAPALLSSVKPRPAPELKARAKTIPAATGSAGAPAAPAVQ
ncbi:MAG: sulfatase family protein [Kiloniellales bacterium]